MKKAAVIIFCLGFLCSCTKQTAKRAPYLTCGAKMPKNMLAKMKEFRDKNLQGQSQPQRFQTELAIINDDKWPNGSTLRVAFMNGSTPLQNRVKSVISEWTNYANIHLAYATVDASDIRINFATDNTYWSYYGTDANYYQGQETTHLGFPDGDQTSDADIRAYAVHEFGHSLGSIHEHQSPSAKISWNKAQVYADCATWYGWNQELVDDNILNPFSAEYVSFGPFDPKSIMTYYIPATWTTNGVAINANGDLSDMDKSFIAQAYPKQ